MPSSLYRFDLTSSAAKIGSFAVEHTCFILQQRYSSRVVPEHAFSMQKEDKQKEVSNQIPSEPRIPSNSKNQEKRAQARLTIAFSPTPNYHAPSYSTQNQIENLNASSTVREGQTLASTPEDPNCEGPPTRLYQFHVRLEAVKTGGFHWRRAGSIFRAPLTFSFSRRLLCSPTA